jgi:excisionase family DNA binding protein
MPLSRTDATVATFRALLERLERLTEDHRRVAEALVRLELDVRELRKSTETPEAVRNTPAPAAAIPRLIRLVEVTRRVGLSRSTVYKLLSEGRFPPPRRLGPRSVALVAGDIDAWIESRPRR